MLKIVIIVGHDTNNKSKTPNKKIVYLDKINYISYPKYMMGNNLYHYTWAGFVKYSWSKLKSIYKCSLSKFCMLCTWLDKSKEKETFSLVLIKRKVKVQIREWNDITNLRNIRGPNIGFCPM